MNKYENEWIIWDEQIWKWMNILRRMNLKINEYSDMKKIWSWMNIIGWITMKMTMIKFVNAWIF